MTPAPLQLIDYWATAIRMEACADYDPEAETELDFDSIKVEHSVKALDSPEPETIGTRWLVGISIEQAPCASANIPYTFAVSLQGLVLALPNLTGDRLDRAIRANGPAMLFGSAREMIRAATGRGPHNAVIIPSTNFLSPPPVEPATKKPKAVKKTTKKATAKKTGKKKVASKGTK